MASNEPMELITSCHNHYFYVLVRVLSQLAPNETITCQDFFERVNKLLYLNGELTSSEYNHKVVANLLDIACKYGIFDRKGQNITKMIHNYLVPPLSVPEKIYLKNILQGPHAKLFLDEPSIQKLLNVLSDVPDVPFSEIIDVKGIKPEIDVNDTYIEDFRAILRATRKNLRFCATNTTLSGDIYRNNSVPLKIEFSIKERYFCNVAWSLRPSRLYSADIGRLSNVRLKRPMGKYRCAMTKMGQRIQKKAPLIMFVRNIDNSIEQAHRLFGSYPKEVQRFNDEIIWMAVQYPRFDEDKLIDDILSLGTAVQVTSPKRVVEKIKNKLKNKLSVE